MQLLQCKNEFTAKCITMDAQLLTAVGYSITEFLNTKTMIVIIFQIVSGIATYLLILIQFLKTKKNLTAENELQ